MTVIRVAARSRPGAVAGAIGGVIREGRSAEVRAIGARAVNQAVKAVIIARRYLAEESIDVICLPAFAGVEVDGLQRMAIKLIVEPR